MRMRINTNYAQLKRKWKHTEREPRTDRASQIEVKTKTGAATKMTAEVEEPTTKATGEENKPKAHPKRKRTHQTKRQPNKPTTKVQPAEDG